MPPAGSGPDAAQGRKPFELRRGRVDSLTLYEITEEELRQIGEGSPVNVHQSIAIGSGSIAATVCATLFTATFSDPTTEFTFVALAVGSIIATVIEGIMWFRCRGLTSTVIKRITGRTPQ